MKEQVQRNKFFSWAMKATLEDCSDHNIDVSPNAQITKHCPDEDVTILTHQPHQHTDSCQALGVRG